MRRILIAAMLLLVILSSAAFAHRPHERSPRYYFRYDRPHGYGHWHYHYGHCPDYYPPYSPYRPQHPPRNWRYRKGGHFGFYYER